jgi:hypothetical protein
MSYAYLKARNARWWVGFAFSFWLAATLTAGALISAAWPSDGGARRALSWSRLLTAGCGLPALVPAPCFEDARLEYQPGERASAVLIVEAFENCVRFDCFKVWRDASTVLYISPIIASIITAVILFFARRREKTKNRDEQLRGSSIVDSRALRRRVNQLDPD